MNEPKRGNVREDGMVCWGHTWKDAAGTRRYMWVTPEKFEEKRRLEAERLSAYAESNRDRIREVQRAKYEQNREDYLAKAKARYKAKKQEILAKNREYAAKNKEKLYSQKQAYRAANRERVRVWCKRYESKNRHKRAERDRIARRTNPLRRLKDAIRGSVRAYIGTKKNRDSTTFQIVGCTPDELRAHLESKFRDGMTWENYGRYWHVDHIVPLSSGKTQAELFRLSHWTNLQPLTVAENLAKGDRIPIS